MSDGLIMSDRGVVLGDGILIGEAE
jgi:hypothetical protein